MQRKCFLTCTTEDLDKAIDLGLHAIEIERSNCRRPRFSTLTVVANLLDLRHQYTLSDGRDIEKSVTIRHEVLEICPVGFRDRWELLGNLAMTLHLRFSWGGELDDLEKAVRLSRQAVDEAPTDHPRGFAPAILLAEILSLRFNEVGDLADLNEAVHWSTRAMAIVSPSVADYSTVVLGTVSHLCSRFTQLFASEDIEMAIILSERLLASIPADHADHVAAVYSLAKSLLLRGPMQNNTRDVRSKFLGIARVLGIIQTSYGDILAAEKSVSTTLLDMYVQAVGLLPRIAFFGLQLQARLQSLISGQHIALAGASHALNMSFPQVAIEILEQGRAVFWTHALRLRSPFDAVPIEFRHRLSSLARQLDQVSDSTSYSTPDPRIVEAAAMRRRQQSEEFNRLLDEVRAVTGFQRFLLPDQFSTLAKAAERGPVIVLVSSTLACHAIVIRSCGDPVTISLSSVTDAWLLESGSLWRSVVTKARSTLRNRLKLAKSAGRITERHAKAEEILQRLWVDVVTPVLEELRVEVRFICRKRPRIWWCPTGHFVHLPIHAAGVGRDWCSDFVVSSYVPTLGSLISARESYVPIEKRNVRALVAAVSHSSMTQWEDLLATEEEMCAVREALPDGATIALPPSDDALIGVEGGISADTFLHLLPQATILHLACHGQQNPENPLMSGFVMRDNLLTIETLMPVALPRAFMAFLSACETAKGTTFQNHPDQTVHLAATMLFAGFKSVIATLWYVAELTIWKVYS
ncbi:hypothetical protein PUNSTDRAFT_74979 [Punctularia strigosozonata HHB-11173 SS5]|uniref:CHAT domain-containing protein n=1 Tax=Punctularia strigosozonata (strain HHB-11173) TaxID=741275 RepID=R7S5Y9_PUNST|nr:uncharacterized protein PUNSTDRAFT_74979 [Punctularia strigosozonata HHB-11173 SS5]EIN05296.1 hypothetical protein PUNSTDRAFT_74979 [Punctularia strigosozonata HHB-11173 SS5]